MVNSNRAMAIEIFAVVFEDKVCRGRGTLGAPQGKRKPQGAFCRVKRASKLRKVAGPRFK